MAVAAKAKFVFYFVLCLFLLLPSQAKGAHNLATVSSVLSDKGYHAMSLTFSDLFFNTLGINFTGNNSTTLTLFCPLDQAFLSSKLFPQPPLTQLQYHLIPSTLARDRLASLPPGSKVDTLLSGHPLVVTTLPGAEHVSLNQVRVSEWDLYNDGRLIIHGVEDFFDPAFQTLRYPLYDRVEEIHGKVVSGFSWIRTSTENWIKIVLRWLH